jgi:outer membrane protein TolC
MTISETRTLTEGEFDVVFPDQSYLIGDWSYATAQNNVEKLIADPSVDVVITWGQLVSHAICCFVNLPKPVVAPVIVDHVLQDVPYVDGSSGVANLNYVSFEDKVASEFEVFQRIVPFRKVAFLGNREFFESLPMLRAQVAQTVSEAGFELEFLGAPNTASETLALITDDFDAVYVWPLFFMAPEEFQKVIDGLNDLRLPTFSGWGSQDVEAGLLASATSDEFFPRLARRVALNLQRILLGEEAADIPVDFSFRQEVVINMATARRIGVSPGWDVLVEARLLHPEQSDLPTMSLQKAVDEAVAVNLDLLARERALAASAEEIEKARSNYKPQLGVSLLGLQIDKDRARASLGSQPERSLTGSAALSQLIFSDPALANIKIQREVQLGQEFDFEALRLDIALQSSVTYLNLLRAKSLVRIQRRNLEITRSNLELAKIRRSIGAANPAEVLRWESQIATDRKTVVEFDAQEKVAEIALNRLLNRDLEQRFLTEEVDLQDPSLITGQERFTGYTETPARFLLFSDFMVQEGLATSPELAQVDTLIRAQQRLIQSTKRAYWAPDLGFEAGIDEFLRRAGEGADRGFPGGEELFPFNNDTSWSLGVSASLPLYAGGRRLAERVQAEIDLQGLQLQRDSASQRIDERIRSGMQLARSSFAGIGLSEQASSAASQTLELVSDAYARGAVSILDLLDAQRNALNAEQLVTNSRYDFLVDLMEVQRAANRSDFFMTAEQRDLWFERLEQYFEFAEPAPLSR